MAAAERKRAKRSLACAILRRDFLYSKAVAAGELRTALDIEKDRCQLEQIYPKAEIKHEHTGRDGQAILFKVYRDIDLVCGNEVVHVHGQRMLLVAP